MKKLLLNSMYVSHYRYDTPEERRIHINDMISKGYILWNYSGNGERGNWYEAIFYKPKEKGM